MLKKFGAVCLAAAACSKGQSISRPAVESAELQFTHPAAGDTVAVFEMCIRDRFPGYPRC